jgi:hypothetical protein
METLTMEELVRIRQFLEDAVKYAEPETVPGLYRVDRLFLTTETLESIKNALTKLK